MKIERFYKEVPGTEEDALDVYNQFCIDTLGIIRTINVDIRLLGFNKHSIVAYYERT